MTEQGTARRRPLSDSLGREAVLLVEQLRCLKQRTGLSLTALAARTAYSKSAWHRYLNGDQFPPRAAVEALGRLAAMETAPLLALWDSACRAETAQQRAVQQPPAPARAPAADVRARRLQRVRRTAAVLVSATLGAAACAVGVPLLPDGTSARPVACHGPSCRGQDQDPAPSRCYRDARTESAFTDRTYVVRLLFSPSCATVRAEVKKDRLVHAQ
ncbi:helix-turn-helix transcriptional regulator [Streptomyces sp. CdTB01]|uniref:helix-turn-helix domain-containing protein n=1 Tax=Streptomyces sp. CdTB01 TaxID=1725411 RepID=UPI00073A7DD1|nr:helix-turn-helix transcriptional regulator [Streptomyces sp. CdTB01]ALV33120.1 hypothetical protein AS200_14495 [Streptomyces sp. CdTB01]